MENQTFETIDLTQPEEPKTAPAPKAKRAPAKRKAAVESEPISHPPVEETSQPSEPIPHPPVEETSPPSEPAEQTEPLISPKGDNESPPEVEPPTPKPKAKAKSRAKSKPPPTPEVVDVETTTRKPKGHRPKMENKPDLKEKMPCEHCGKMVSRHNLKYTHKCSAKSAPVLEQPATIMEQLAVPPPLPLTRSSTIAPMTFIAPLTVREKMQQQRVSVANRLIAQAFS